MDISVLPNSNHPEKLFQLDVEMLPATRDMFQVGAVMCSQRHWQNRVYFEREQTGNRSLPSQEGTPVIFVDRYLEKHITPVTLKSNIKCNPLYVDITPMDSVGDEKFKPSWTVEEYDTQSIDDNFAKYLKNKEKTAKDLDFWLEDLYTPGFDSLLKKAEEHKRNHNCRILFAISLSVFAILIIIIVPVVVLQQN